jgi:hypothetical protein
MTKKRGKGTDEEYDSYEHKRICWSEYRVFFTGTIRVYNLHGSHLVPVYVQFTGKQQLTCLLARILQHPLLALPALLALRCNIGCLCLR